VTATYKDATSIDEISLNEIRIYPNPVKDELHINFPSFENLESLNAQIYDISGRTVGALRATPTDNGTAAINVSNLSSGVYFLKIGDKRVRFVKE
ncbi:MAG: T9SS type A sorting domain-containing protein, partial [Candidatus Symbiothrix sp.]|jgi:hypothetical protein|nr:T9SS type A sorting domain-containing protein [Candidatus Symbiothrix sp.]